MFDVRRANWTAEGNKYKGGIYMVFEYMDHDLTGLADRPGMRFSVPQIKVSNVHYPFCDRQRNGQF